MYKHREALKRVYDIANNSNSIPYTIPDHNVRQ